MKPLLYYIFIVLLLGTVVACQAAEEGEMPALSTATTAPQPTPTATTIPQPTAIISNQPVTAQMELPGLDDWQRVPLTQTIHVTFDQPMDPDSSRAPIILQPTWRGIFSWSDDFRQLTYTPQQPFPMNRNYRIILNNQLRTLTDNRLAENYQWQITTLLLPSVARKTWVESSHPRYPHFTIHFNLAMDTSCLPTVTTPQNLPLEVSWDNDRILLVEVIEALSHNQTYAFSLQPNCRDQAGLSMKNGYEWEYTPPALVATARLLTANDGRYPVQIQFNYAMAQKSVEEAFRISSALQDEAVAGTFRWDNLNKTLTFTPDRVMLGNTTYHITLAADTLDQAGLRYNDWATELKTPSPITTYYPSGESVYPSSEIRIVFNQPVNQPSVEEAFTITPEVAGTFHWQANDLFFEPIEDYLVPLTDYTIFIDNSIQAANGQQILGEPFVWHFSTSDLQTVAGFGVGTHLQVMDSESEMRTIHFSTYQAEPTRLKLELFALTETQLLEIYPALPYSGNFWEYDPEDRQVIELDAPPIREWLFTTELITNTEQFWAQIYPQAIDLPDDLPAGIYLLNMNAGKLNDQIVIILTPYSLVLYEDSQNGLVWLSDLYEEAVEGAIITAYDETLQPFAQGITDNSGLYRLTRPTARPYLVTARVGDVLTIAGIDPTWQRRSFYGQNAGYTPISSPSHVAYIYTDRPIYRPGDTVYFKTIVRQDNDAILAVVPAGTPFTARLQDSRKNTVQTLELTANDFGTADGQFTIADGAMLGYYHVEITIGETTIRQEFKVQDYRKPDYAVTVTTNKSDYLAGEEVQLQVSGSYFLGEPTSNAQVVVKNYLLASYYDWRIDQDKVTWVESYGSGVVQEQGRMDSAGTYQLTYSANRNVGDDYYYYNDNYDYWDTNLRREQWAVEATVNDGSNQTVSGYATYTVYNVSEIIRLTTGGYFHRPGETIPIGITVLDIAGNPVANRSVTLNLQRWNESNYKYDIVVQQETVTSDNNGQASITFNVTNAGYYKLFATSRDAQNHPIETTRWLYVFDRDFSSWYGESSALKINADQEQYAPGETAQLVVETHHAGPALMTVQRGTVRRQQLVTLTPPVTVLPLTIEEGDIPNIYVSLSLWVAQDTKLEEYQYISEGNASLLQASVMLSVPASTKILNVTITPDQSTYAPGEQANVTVRVTNYRGEPVSAELALAVVDEAIFSLSSELAGAIYDAFYFKRGSLVRTYDSMKPFRILWESGGLGGGGGGNVPTNPRTDFEDTAAWFPTLHTNANGEATISFTLPDNLTSWRLTAKAATTDTQIGEATANITVTKPIVVRPILPRTLTTGDQLTLSAIVSNYSDSPQTLSVYLYAGISNPQGSDLLSSRPSPLEITSDITHTITLAPGEQTIVGWSLSAEKAGTAVLIAWANFADGTEADAIELPLIVQPLSIPNVTIEVGSFSGIYETTVQLPANTLDLSSVRIELSRSIAGTLLNGLEYLTGYPYGCVEQTMSRALPTAAVARAFFQLGINGQLPAGELDAQINASIQRLYGFQHEDGGWGWWFDDNSHDYQTAWVLFGLSVISDAGYEIDPDVLQRAVSWITSNWSTMSPSTRAYALYAMTVAGYANEELANQLLESFNLDHFSQAALSLTLHKMGRMTDAQQVMDSLLAKATILENDQVFWAGTEGDGEYRRKTMASTTRTTALVLSALVQVRPGHELESGTVRWLMANRQDQGWGTTNETSYAILGLTDHLVGLGFGNENAGTTYTLLLNDELYANGTLAGGLPNVAIEIPVSDLKAGENSLRIEQSGQGELYYIINSRLYSPMNEVNAAGQISVSRLYIDPTSDQQITELQAGQLVQVRINVKMLQRRGSYMIIEDKLPGGLEALNEGLNTSSHDSNLYEEQFYQWENLGYNYKEVRGDRVSFFVTEMGTGSYIFSYMARATHAGTFTAMPVEVYAMYDLTLWGRSNSTSLQITPD